QFTHRTLAMTAGLLTFAYGAFYVRHNKIIGFLVMLTVLIQISLGVSTLLSNVLIPLAVMHQINGVLLLTILLISLYAVIQARSAKSLS
ncbi:MAG: COX15/CtaA family protein, partial [Pseudomonadota bacterium]